MALIFQQFEELKKVPAGIERVIKPQVKEQKVGMVADRVSFFPRQRLWLLRFGRLIGDELDFGQRQSQFIAMGDDGGLSCQPPNRRCSFLVQNQVKFGKGFLGRFSRL